MIKLVRAVTSSHFYHPYYFFNLALILCFILLRLTRLDPGELSLPDPLGITREIHVYICLGLMLFVRTLTAPTVAAYISHGFMFSRVAILFLLFMMHTPLFLTFTMLWALIYILFPQPLPKTPAHIRALNPATLRTTVLTNPSQKDFHLIFCHATWATHCAHLAPVYAALSRRYAHPRLHYAKLDLGRYPAAAQQLGVQLGLRGKDLPTVVCFRGGKELGRVVGKRGWRVAEVAENLGLEQKMEMAKRWEEEARKRLKEEQRRRKRR